MIEKILTHICITRKGQEKYFTEDTTCVADKPAQFSQVAPGAVGISGLSARELALLPPFFSQQMLPHAEPVGAQSIKTWAQLLSDRVIEAFSHEQEVPTWVLHIFTPESVETGQPLARARLITEETLSQLKKRRRSLLKMLLPSTPSATGAIVQLLLTDSSHGYLSICPSSERASLQAALRPTLAGFTDIPDDKSPPSRAFKKLIEALTVFNLEPKQGATCVDLGASPGGWTHVLATRGCSITAVDRSPLAPELMRNRRITFLKGDALIWLPQKPVELMVCDVITTPDKTINLLESWLTKKLCAAFCVTVKFKGQPDFAALLKIRRLLSTTTSWYDGKQLCNNKNELTVVGKL